MSFAVVLEGMTLITYVVILSGGKQKRESGWKILSGLHFIVGALQLAGMTLIVGYPLWGLGDQIGSGVIILKPALGVPLRQRRPLFPWVEA